MQYCNVEVDCGQLLWAKKPLVSSVFEQCEGIIYGDSFQAASFCIFLSCGLVVQFYFPFQVQRTLSDTLITCIVGLKWWSCSDSVLVL
jgi:hypothetical protein